MNFIYYYIIILLSWLIIFLINYGIGSTVLRIVRVDSSGTEMIYKSFWVGWATVIMILQLLHIVARVDIITSTFVFVLGVIGLIWNYRIILKLFYNWKYSEIIYIILFCVFSIWLANRATGAISPYDSGLYHLQIIKWISTHPVIPGLGNLHGRFAFNNSSFLYFALIDIGPWSNKSYHIANGVLLLVLFSQILQSIIKILRRNNNIEKHDIFQILLIPPVIYQCILHTSSTSTDLVIFIITIIAGIHLCKFLFSCNTYNDILSETFFIIILCIIGITIKLSFLIFSIICLTIMGLIIFYKQYNDYHGKKKLPVLLMFIILPVLIIFPWIARGIILSGYIAYPVPVGGVNVEWKIPHDKVIHQMRDIKSWARKPYGNPEKVLANWNWFTPWLKEVMKYRFEIIIPLFFFMSGVFLSVYNWKVYNLDLLYSSLLLFPVIGSIIYWFIMAPDLRFISSSFWYIGSGALVITQKNWSMHKEQWKIFGTLFLSITITFFSPLNPLKNKLFLNHSESYGLNSYPQIDTKILTTNSGLKIFVPFNGDQCWNATLPCTPYFNSNLSLRKQGDIRSGFVIDRTDK